MNFPNLENAIKHLKKISKCEACNGKYNFKDMYIVAATDTEALVEMRCPKCKEPALMSIGLATNKKIKENTNVIVNERSSIRIHGRISKKDIVSGNEVLDLRNFLTEFDGNFEKLFSKKLK